jgi:ATP-dependent RNA helicase DHX8/PRP22
MGCELGKEVGYFIRFEDVTSRWTRIKYMTDGMLIREVMLDETLSSYGFIILDEAHERNIHTDVLFTLMKQIVRKNPHLRLIITSATLDAVKFSGFFDNCQVFRIPGRSFEVKVMFAREPELDYLKAGTDCILQIHLSEPPGDILFFLTGQEEIETASAIIEKRLSDLGKDAPPMLIHQIYSALPTEKQTQIFEPAPRGSRKCVIATNIAEASITIDGILYVVDSGFSKVKVYNPKLGMDSLRVTPISQASANQRSGRAGRTAPGKCYRLYTEKSFKTEMLPVSVPEIQRSNLAHTVLILKSLGIHDVLHFELMDPPAVQSLVAALQNLFTLGALDEHGRMTRLGLKMSELPLEPPLAKVLLASVDLICSEEMATIVALLSVQGVFFRPKDKQNLADEKKKRFLKAEGDHLTLLSVFENWKKNNFSANWCHDNFIHFRSMKRAQDIREQLIGQLSQAKLPVLSCRGDYQRIQKALTSGFFEHAAKREPKEGYKTISDNHQVFVHPSSAIFQKTPEYVIYHELVMTSREYMREITPVLPKWLVEVAPNYYQLNTQGRKNEVIKPLNYNKNDPKAGDWKLQNRIRDLSSILR